jgi:hypothetical protein
MSLISSFHDQKQLTNISIFIMYYVDEDAHMNVDEGSQWLHIVTVILNDVGRCQYTCILKFNIMIYWHYLRIIQFYLLKVIYIALYIFAPVATHGHAPSLDILL